MTDGFPIFSSPAGAHGGRAPTRGWVVRPATSTVPLTVPLLCCPGRGGFEAEGPHQVEGGRAHAHLVQPRPQVDHVPLLAAPGVEAVEHVVVQVDAECATAAVGPMKRAGAAP